LEKGWPGCRPPLKEPPLSHPYRSILMTTLAVVAACGISCKEKDAANAALRPVSCGPATVGVPNGWEEVPEVSGTYSPLGDDYRRLYLKVGCDKNARVSSKKVRQRWDEAVEIMRKDGTLLQEASRRQGDFWIVERSRSVPAPSPELIPLEHQTAGDAVLHDVLLYRSDATKVELRWVAEVPRYERHKALLKRVVKSVKAEDKP